MIKFINNSFIFRHLRLIMGALAKVKFKNNIYKTENNVEHALKKTRGVPQNTLLRLAGPGKTPQSSESRFDFPEHAPHSLMLN